MTVAEVVYDARAFLDEEGIPVARDEQVIPEIALEDRQVVLAILQRDNASYPLPGDSAVTGDISAAGSPWLLPDDFFALRRLTVGYDGTYAPLVLVADSLEHRTPQRQPSAFIRRAAIHGIGADADAPASRKWGWAGSESLEMLYLPTLSVLDDPGDTLNAPDDARKYLARCAAYYMAGRAADLAVEVRGFLSNSKKSAWDELMRVVDDYGRRGGG